MWYRNEKKKNRIINTLKLSRKLEPFSKINKSFEGNFFQLIHPNISYDFLMAIYFSVFRKDKWDKNVKILDKKLIKDTNWISNFYNTFFNQIVFVEAFKNSRVYFQSRPLSINT